MEEVDAVAQLRKNEILLQDGTRVTAGVLSDLFGLARVSHLCYEAWIEGRPVDANVVENYWDYVNAFQRAINREGDFIADVLEDLSIEACKAEDEAGSK